MAETNLKTALVCYTQAVFTELEPDDDALEDETVTAKAVALAQLAERISAALNKAGLESDIVKVPQRSPAPRDVSKAAFAWRLLDIKESNGRAIDCVICLDFPAWSVSHPRKIVWLTELPFFVTRRRSSVNMPPNQVQDELTNPVNSLLQAERRGLSEAVRIQAGSRPIAEELARSGLQVEYNPFPPAEAAPDGPEWQRALSRLLHLTGS